MQYTAYDMRISDWIQTCALPISSVDSYGEARRATIEEADHLLNTFNALLDIARAEAGAERQAMTPLDLAALVRDVADLYGPVAEDNGLRLTVLADTSVRVLGNRHLMSQALANLQIGRAHV